ncbi:hypothetical protein [Nocardioides sp.]|uniref:hypothetical protein n=1 Tax=Nocardioides sp. TaxID=35761 RepID=UPI00271B12E4|nr:hypothetical protein [Nocardioides sp.]MDO9456979.1 hypothetical protein [Nocardioides sp.]
MTTATAVTAVAGAPARARDRWDRLGRPARVLAWLFAATVLVKVVVYVGVAGGGLVGDEAYYFDSGRALSNAVRDLVWLRSPDPGEMDRIVVGSGWFMPGMSVVLTPLYLVFPGAPLEVARGYLALLTTLLLLVTALRVRRTLGAVPAGAVLVYPGLVPTYAAFGAAGWGDSAAGLVAVLMVCQAIDMVRAVREHGSISWRAGVTLGVYAIVAVYFRSSVSLLVVGVLGVTFVVSMVLAARAERGRVVLSYVAAGVAFLAILAPWSIGASAALDARVVTTVSVPTVRANTFGDRDLVCFGECDPGSSIWFSPLRYSREQARAAGLSEVDIASEMSAYARRDVTSTSYARDVGINAGRYFYNPARFATLLRWHDAPYSIVPLAEVGTAGLFYPASLLMLVVLGAVTRRSFDLQLSLVLVKVAIITLMVQPFVHIAGPRYWTTLAPLLGLGAALLWAVRRERIDDAPRAGGAVARLLYVAQVGLGLFALAVVVGVGLLAL